MGDFMSALEFDDFDPHTVRDVFDDDRVRQNALVAAGWTVLRVTSRMLEQDPGGLVANIASLMTRGHENDQMRLIS